MDPHGQARGTNNLHSFGVTSREAKLLGMKPSFIPVQARGVLFALRSGIKIPFVTRILTRLGKAAFQIYIIHIALLQGSNLLFDIHLRHMWQTFTAFLLVLATSGIIVTVQRQFRYKYDIIMCCPKPKHG